MMVALLGIGWCGAAEILELTNKAGVTIKGKLLERREDGVTVQVGAKTFEIGYDQLTDETIGMLKAAEIAKRTSEEIRIEVDIKKSGEIKKSGRVRVDDFGNVDDTTGSYRIDTISGSVTITNRNSRDDTAPGTLKVVILKRQDDGVVPMHAEVYALDALDALESRTFEIGESTSTHSAKGMADNVGKPQGRYVGYIAAFLVDGAVVAIRSLPSSYERDPDAAKLLLKAAGGRRSPAARMVRAGSASRTDRAGNGTSTGREGSEWRGVPGGGRAPGGSGTRRCGCEGEAAWKQAAKGLPLPPR